MNDEIINAFPFNESNDNVKTRVKYLARKILDKHRLLKEAVFKHELNGKTINQAKLKVTSHMVTGFQTMLEDRDRMPEIYERQKNAISKRFCPPGFNPIKTKRTANGGRIEGNLLKHYKTLSALCVSDFNTLFISQQDLEFLLNNEIGIAALKTVVQILTKRMDDNLIKYIKNHKLNNNYNIGDSENLWNTAKPGSYKFKNLNNVRSYYSRKLVR